MTATATAPTSQEPAEDNHRGKDGDLWNEDPLR